MSQKSEILIPASFELPEAQVLPNGTMAVSLYTLANLEDFWSRNCDAYPYACEGTSDGFEPIFLKEYQWVFGATKAAVIETVIRLGQSSIQPVFYNWKESNPREWESFFTDRASYRSSSISAGKWTVDDEITWQREILRRNKTTYHGWWRFEGIAQSMSVEDWFDAGSDAEELIDPDMPVEQVTRLLCEQTFDEWHGNRGWQLETHNHESLDKMIAYWRKEKGNGQDYYGVENEAVA